MDRQQQLRSLQGGLIVSCQAPADSPLHQPEIIAAIAAAAVQRGAVGIRLDTPEHVQAVRDRLPDTPIIGLWKRTFPDSPVYITPRYAEAEAIAAAGADIIALDCTLRPRPDGEDFRQIIPRIQQELGRLVMADVDTMEAAIAAAEAGADLIGTTLYGYTEATQGRTPPGWDLLAAAVQQIPNTPMICEGGIASAQAARQACDRGAFAVVVGTAITGIDLQVQAYVAALNARL
ncbi:N-acetylmannosamine-6-phosphate 2-epimerase [Synechococcus elongatus IITB7]|uniref:N-acetylmannosamine-6-phosphate 2-epimerase n=1 Tax=Synechococcus elongatus TaxID=32046 RepID=UPI0030D046F7